MGYGEKGDWLTENDGHEKAEEDVEADVVSDIVETDAVIDELAVMVHTVGAPLAV